MPAPAAGTAKTIGRPVTTTHTYTDLVTTDLTYQSVTSVLRPFVAGDAGSWLWLQSGGNGLPGRYHVGSVTSGAATLDRPCATGSLSAGTGPLETPGNPHRFFIVEPGAGVLAKPMLNKPFNELDGGFELKRTILEQKQYEGTFKFFADGENLQYLLMGMFGRDIQTQLTAGANQHQFSLNSLGYAPSFSVEEIFGDATYGRLSTGCLVEKLTLDFANTLTAEAQVCAFRQIPNSYPQHASLSPADFTFGAAASVYPDCIGGNGTNTLVRTSQPAYIDVAQGNNGQGPFVFGSAAAGSQSGFSGGFVTIDGASYAAELQPGLQIMLERKLDRQLVMGSGYDQGVVSGQELQVTGKLPVVFTDASIPLAGLRHSDVGLNFKLVGGQIGSTGEMYSLEIYLPRVKLENVGLQANDNLLVVNATFTARADPALGCSALLTLVNSFDSTGVDSLAPGAGGLGGMALV